MDPKQASFELFNALKQHKEVIGTSVQRSAEANYIVVYLTKITSVIKSQIPTEYRGNRVKTRISGGFSG